MEDVSTDMTVQAQDLHRHPPDMYAHAKSLLERRDELQRVAVNVHSQSLLERVTGVPMSPGDGQAQDMRVHTSDKARLGAQFPATSLH